MPPYDGSELSAGRFLAQPSPDGRAVRIRIEPKWGGEIWWICSGRVRHCPHFVGLFIKGLHHVTHDSIASFRQTAVLVWRFNRRNSRIDHSPNPCPALIPHHLISFWCHCHVRPSHLSVVTLSAVLLRLWCDCGMVHSACGLRRHFGFNQLSPGLMMIMMMMIAQPVHHQPYRLANQPGWSSTDHV